MKKLLVVCLAVLMMTFLLSGCGETATPSTSPAEDFLYEENEDGTITVSWYNGEDAHVVIPGTIDGKTVTAIRTGAFANRDFLVSVVIPDTVTVLEHNSFPRCTALESVVFSENLVDIESLVFDDCTSLKSIRLPESLETIGYGAFKGCSNLENVDMPDGEIDMADDVFARTKLFASTRPSEKVDNVSKCGYSENEDGTLKILYCRSESSDVVIPQTIDGKAVTKIDLLAFWADLSLSSIELPDTITELNAGTFRDCSNLEKVILPKNLKEIPDSLFEDCVKLKEVQMPENLERIGDKAFMGCSSLESIDLPDSLTDIGEDAFAGTKVDVSL